MRINGKDYRIPELGFEQMCDLEDRGISLFDISNPGRKLLSILRSFVAIATGLDNESASELIEQHVYGGGNFDGWLDEINKAVEDSGFFQAVLKQEEKKQEKAQAKTQKAKEKAKVTPIK